LNGNKNKYTVAAHSIVLIVNHAKRGEAAEMVVAAVAASVQATSSSKLNDKTIGYPCTIQGMNKIMHL